MDKYIEEGRELDVYLDSEQSDQETGRLDDLWQSIYDVVQLGYGGIIESDPRELEEAYLWLEKTQEYTEDYKNLELPQK